MISLNNPLQWIMAFLLVPAVAGTIAGYLKRWKLKTRDQKMVSIQVWIVSLALLALAVSVKNAEWPQVKWSMISQAAACLYGVWVAVMMVVDTVKYRRKSVDHKEVK